MISLEEHSKRRFSFNDLSKPRLNGIACPLCGHELMDSTPEMILTSHPPQYNIHCPSCSYHGYRY